MLPVFRSLVVGVNVPFLLVVTPPFTLRRVNAARFAAVGVGVMLPLLLLLVPLFTQPRGKILPVYRPLV